MRARTLATAVAATLAVATLAGCRTNVGTAATVDGQRISETTISSYARPSGPDASVAAQAKAAGQSISPKSLALGSLIREKVLERVLAKDGGIPSKADLSTVRDVAAQTFLLQSSSTGGALTAALTHVVVASGVDASLVPHLFRMAGLEYVLVERIKAKQLSDVSNAVEKAKIKVTVSPRFGTWDVKNLQLNDAGATPAYLKLQPSAGAAAASASPSPGSS